MRREVGVREGEEEIDREPYLIIPISLLAYAGRWATWGRDNMLDGLGVFMPVLGRTLVVNMLTIAPSITSSGALLLLLLGSLLSSQVPLLRAHDFAVRLPTLCSVL